MATEASTGDSDPRQPPWAPHPLVLRVTALAGCLVVVGAAVWMVLQVIGLLTLVLFPLVITLFATRALSGPAAWLRRRGWSDGLAATATLGSALATVALAIALIAPPLVAEFSDLGPTLDKGLGEIEDWLVEESSFDISRADIEDAKETAADRARQVLEDSQEQVAEGARLAVTALAGLLLSLILTFFALKDGHRLAEWIEQATPPRRRRELVAAGQAGWGAIGGYLRGAALLGVVEAIVIGAAMALAGAGLVVPVMLLTFAAAFVPIVGAVAAGIIAVLVTLAAGGLVPALIVGVVALVVQQVDNDLLAPWIYGKALELHPAAVLLSITAGTALFGFAGTILAVPITAAVVGSVLAVKAIHAGDSNSSPNSDSDESEIGDAPPPEGDPAPATSG